METIYWFVLNANDLPPSETYLPVQRYNEDTFGCPQMVKYNQHRAYIESPVSFELRNNELYVEKEMPRMFNIMHTGHKVMQMPYCFLTKNKNIKLFLQNISTLEMTEGIIPIGKYPRIINYTFKGNGKVNQGDPIVQVLFNEPVKLVHIVPNESILNFVQSTYQISHYKNNITKIFNRTSIAYPRKELDKCQKR